jgi:hypothetical protein
MTDLYRCPNCRRSYRADKLAECPGCFTDAPYMGEESPVSGKNWGSSNASTNDFLSTTTIVAAQDRTTHAIRSLAVFVLVSISTSLIGYLIIAISAGSVLGCSSGDSSCYASSGGAIYLGIFVIGGGFITALVLGIRELSLSKP